MGHDQQAGDPALPVQVQGEVQRPADSAKSYELWVGAAQETCQVDRKHVWAVAEESNPALGPWLETA